MHADFGEFRDFICRKCGLYGMVDVIGMEFVYDPATGVLYDVIDDPDGRRQGDQIVCDCGCEFFDMQIHSKRGK
ncbi:hypothetical protein Dbac_1684 [Desulfomicrobium baculatum DSM 4028]|uniref:Uncharacterized protein n=2 Tax=Desulfomicrobium baculatum TaxID=899 RepID=C7LVM0_DESBD|nr:hypothetical protein Dbac_1684 [Desulfomicrobium baculatum DSM 4028]